MKNRAESTKETVAVLQTTNAQHPCSSGAILVYVSITLAVIQFILLTLVHQHHDTNYIMHAYGSAGEHLVLELQRQKSQESHPRCAVNLWGLPRAFESLVLPSLQVNIIQTNAKYNCDYFVHYFELDNEPAGRSGNGGKIHAQDVYLLRAKVKQIYKEQQQHLHDNNHHLHRTPIVEFTSTKDQDFYSLYKDLLHMIRNTTSPDGNYFYYPYKANTYKQFETTDNIIKMWHTIQASYLLMQKHARRQGIAYERIGMFRNDAVYVTPMDLYQIKNGTMDWHNKVAVVPGFGRHPVSDRSIYGPARAVQIWASGRFERLRQHVEWMYEHDPGWGLHSERFVNYTLFRAIRDAGVEIVEHEHLCFFRARADESVWLSDCDGTRTVTLPSIVKNLGNDRKGLIEKVLNRKCGAMTITKRPRVEQLDCRRSLMPNISLTDVSIAH